MIKILITSGKGGVGKTTITANIGAMLSVDDKKIVLIDGDAGLRNLDIALGLSSKIVFDAIDIINDKAKVEDAAISHPLYPNLHLITAPQDKKYSKYDMAKLCKMLDKNYDICIIDSPAGIDEGFSVCAHGVDIAIIIATPDVSSVRDAIVTKKKLEDENIERIYALVNRTRPKMARRGQCMTTEDVEEILQCKVIGSIRESDDIIKTGNLGIIPNKGKSKGMFLEVKNQLTKLINLKE